MRRLLLASLVLAFVVAIGGAAADAATPRYGSFRTPSGNIVCVWGIDDGPYPPFVRCDIRSGLVPFPARPRCCPRDSDY